MMKFEDWVELVLGKEFENTNSKDYGRLRIVWSDAVSIATKYERERCAKLCETVQYETANDIADAIRKGDSQ